MNLLLFSPIRVLLSLFLSLFFFKTNAAGFTLFGPTIIDVSGCSTAGPTGKVDAIYFIQRNQAVAPPTIIKLLNSSPDVSVSFSNDHLTFPGGAVAELITISFEIISGQLINNLVLNFLVVDGIGNRLEFPLILSGTCPRHNNDFIIRGDFQSVQANVSFPVESAIVEIYRDVRWGDDQHVGSVLTDEFGHFEKKLWADDVDEYYARLLLNDGQGVYLHDWYDPNITSYDSYNRGENNQPVIELGATIISVDGGSGTPKSAVWLGARAAYREFIELFGVAPPVGNYEIINQNIVGYGAWTYRSVTNWRDGTPTYDAQIGTPVTRTDISNFRPYFSQFKTYANNFHEFGHALRHTVDGDERHFSDDNSKYIYGRDHNVCQIALPSIQPEAFAFNEGWGWYWGRYPKQAYINSCGPTPDLTDMGNEGAVMNDLNVIANALDDCLGHSDFRIDQAQEQRRRMFNVLSSGQDIIHSDADFRAAVARIFPGCPLPIPGLGFASSPLEAEPGDAIVNINAIKKIQNLVQYYQHYSDSLQMKLPEYRAEVRQTQDCRFIPCAEYAAILFRPTQAKAQIQYANLVAQRFQQRLNLLQKKCSPEKLIQRIDAKGDKQLMCFQQKTDHQYKSALMSNIKDLKKKGKSLDTDFSEILLALEAKLKAIELGGHGNTRAFFPQSPESSSFDELRLPIYTSK